MRIPLLLAGLAAFAFAPQALAQPASLTYGEDYTVSDEVHSIATVKVAPNRLENYLAGLSTSWIPAMEIGVEMGLMDDYKIYTSELQSGGHFNVLLVQIFENPAQRSLLDDPARAMAYQDRVEQRLSEAEAFVITEGYTQIREINGEYLMREVMMQD